MSDPAVYAVLKLAMKGFPMFIVRWWGKTLYKRAKGQGIGRHTKDEVMGLGMADIRSISAFLGEWNTNGVTKQSWPMNEPRF